MIKQLLLFAALFQAALSFCQVNEKEKNEILAEGWAMYNSERASWLGTDIFFEKFPAKREKMGGYISYTEGKQHKCIFYDRQENPNVITAITFDDNFVPQAAVTDTLSRKFTATEGELYTMRKKTMELIYKDTLFKRYEKTSLNLVPMIINKKKKVYILTGPSDSGVVIFGNDYRIDFDNKNNIKSYKALHKNIIPIDYSKGDDDVVTMHSHLESTGDLITATDICTLLLYGPYAHWQQHYVISRENVSIWDCDKESLFVLTRKAWDKIAEDQKKRHKESGEE